MDLNMDNIFYLLGQIVVFRDNDHIGKLWKNVRYMSSVESLLNYYNKRLDGSLKSSITEEGEYAQRVMQNTSVSWGTYHLQGDNSVKEIVYDGRQVWSCVEAFKRLDGSGGSGFECGSTKLYWNETINGRMLTTPSSEDIDFKMTMDEMLTVTDRPVHMVHDLSIVNWIPEEFRVRRHILPSSTHYMATSGHVKARTTPSIIQISDKLRQPLLQHMQFMKHNLKYDYDRKALSTSNGFWLTHDKRIILI
jgi:hypothetical protein